jgi:hypothetical protein
MILALVTPYYFASVRGNSITVQRIESGLRDQGLTVQVFSLDRQDRDAILGGLRHAIGRRARQKVAAHFTLEGEIGASLTLYQSLLAKTGV